MKIYSTFSFNANWTGQFIGYIINILRILHEWSVVISYEMTTRVRFYYHMTVLNWILSFFKVDIISIENNTLSRTLHVRAKILCNVWSYDTIYDIQDIYFSEVNTKYISSNVWKKSAFSWVRSTSEIDDIFNTWDETFLVFTEKK